jgi:L-ascorbate metabolism protein UlaG (beta-lactamase superfamily)
MISATGSKIGLIVVLAVVVAAVPIGVYLVMSPTTNTTPPTTETVKLTLLYNAGVMIEASGLRIYIDPVNLTADYIKPADAILITHDHGDHYNSSIVQMLQKTGTVNVFPKMMTAAIAAHNGVGVSPRDHVQVGPVNITAFYMYTFAPEGYDASHPREYNYTSYIIDINGYTIFHAGDSKNISEYELLKGTIDVALLPLGPGCQTMYRTEVVDAIQVIRPKYMVPIHFLGQEDLVFEIYYAEEVSSTTGCQIVRLPYFGSHTFDMQ